MKLIAYLCSRYLEPVIGERCFSYIRFKRGVAAAAPYSFVAPDSFVAAETLRSMLTTTCQIANLTAK